MTEIDYKKFDLKELAEHEQELKKALKYKRDLSRRRALTQIAKLMHENELSIQDITEHQAKGSEQSDKHKTRRKKTEAESEHTETQEESTHE